MQIFGIKNSNLVSFRASPFSNTDVTARSSKVSSTVLNAPPKSSNILLNSFLTASRKTATVEIGSAPAGFRVNETFQFLKKQFQVPDLPVTKSLQNKPGTSNLKNDSLQNIKDSLENLASDVSNLRKVGSLNIRSASSTRPKLVEVTTTRQSPFGTFSVKPERTAAGNVLVSDAQDPDLSPLQLSGNFVINGFKVTIQTSDSLVDIRNKINFGEDTNRNGALDPAEDFNGNNIIETLEVTPSEFGPGVFIIEDKNGNGILDPSEDTNGNDRLDGGTGEIKASASIQRNRLVLTSLTGGASLIDLQDDDGILLALGFFELNGKGSPILKEQQVDFSFNPPRDLNQTPQTAKIEVDGTTVTNNTNTFNNAIEDTQLRIKQTSTERAQIRVFTDADKIVGQIKNFFDSFNESIKKINNALRSPSLFAGDPGIQRIRKNLLDNSQRDIRKINEENRAIDKIRANRENDRDLGLKIVNNKKSTIQEVALTRVAQAIKDKVTLPFKNTGNDLLRRLTSIGILTENDDTIKVNEAQLKRALTINPDTVLSLFTNPETGLLPRLDQELTRVLKANLGNIDLKRNEIAVNSDIPSQLVDKFQRFVANVTFNDKVQNLIAVV